MADRNQSLPKSTCRILTNIFYTFSKVAAMMYKLVSFSRLWPRPRTLQTRLHLRTDVHHPAGFNPGVSHFGAKMRLKAEISSTNLEIRI